MPKASVLAQKKRTQISTGVPLLDRLTGGGLPAQSITYLVGTPASGRALLAASFITGGEASIWINVGGLSPSLTPQLQQVLDQRSDDDKFVLRQCTPGSTTPWPGELLLPVGSSKPDRLIVWGADLLELSSPASELVAILAAVRKARVAAVLVGTVGAYGADIQIPTPLLLAHADNVIFTQSRLDAPGQCAAIALKRAAQPPDLKAIRYTLHGDSIELLESAAPLTLPPRTTKHKQAYIVIPELFYLSREHETFIKSRVEQVNSSFQHSEFDMPGQRFANSVQYNAQLEEVRKGSEPWDLFILDIYRLRELIKAELIQPLDEFLPSGWEEKYLPIAVDQCRIDGRIWALPHWINIGVLVYRRDLLRKHNMEPPRTWAELVHQSSSIIKAEHNDRLHGYGFQGAQVEALTCNFLEMLWGNAGQVYDASRHLNLNSSEAVEALQLMCDLVYKHKVAPAQTPSFTEAHSQQMFLDHELVFTRSWPLFLSNVPSTFSSPYENVSIAPLPTFSETITPRGVIGGFCYVVGRHVRNPEVLIEFYNSFYDEATVTQSAIDGWMCSPFRAAYRSAEVLGARSFLKSMPQLLQTGSARGEIPHYGKLTELVRREVNLALRQIKTPREALDTAATELHNQIFRQFREQRLLPVLQYVDENLHEDLSRDKAASVCHLSASYFSAVFAEVYGCSFTRYVSEKRIEKAKDLLERSGMTISEIGHSVGFKDQSYFCQVFRHFTNMTPTEYRMNAMTKVSHH